MRSRRGYTLEHMFLNVMLALEAITQVRSCSYKLGLVDISGYKRVDLLPFLTRAPSMP